MANYSAFGFTNLVRFFFLVICLIFLVYCFLIVNAETEPATNQPCQPSLYSAELFKNYNNVYPLTAPIKSKNFIRYRIGLISDEDRKSGSYAKNSWSSFYLKGYLTYFPSTRRVEIKFDDYKHKVTNRFANGKRGLELSELIVFNGKIYTCDDKTGIIYELAESDSATANSSTLDSKDPMNINYNDTYKLIPSMIMSDGDGHQDEVFKCEWLVVKDHQLYIGSFGRDFQLHKKTKYSSFIKRVNLFGLTEHLNWTDNYMKLQNALNLSKDGYLTHETAMFSTIANKWYFLPRKVSNTSFNFVEDESKCSNDMIIASEDFKEITSHKVGELNKFHGFSTSKFLPGSNDEIIVALKTKEVNNTYSTFITVFDLKGVLLYPETLVDDNLKFEGIEFV